MYENFEFRNLIVHHVRKVVCTFEYIVMPIDVTYLRLVRVVRCCQAAAFSRDRLRLGAAYVVFRRRIKLIGVSILLSKEVG